jgi:hypothetical protein
VNNYNITFKEKQKAGWRRDEQTGQHPVVLSLLSAKPRTPQAAYDARQEREREKPAEQNKYITSLFYVKQRLVYFYAARLTCWP